MDRIKYRTLPLPRRKKDRTPSSNDDSAIKHLSSNGKETPKKSGLGKSRKKSHRSSEIPASTATKLMGIEKDVDKLQGAEKNVMASLKWFFDVVEKDTLIMLAGSTTDVLQQVMELNNNLNTCLNHEESSLLISQHSNVYQSVANLIRWSDKILLYGTSSLDKQEGEVFTEAVKSGVKELVKLYISKLRDKEQQKLNLTNSNHSPEKKATPLTATESYPLSPHERDVLERSPITPDYKPYHGKRRQTIDVTPIPPKPPLPPQRLYVTPEKLKYDYNVATSESVWCNQHPPPLPPKQKANAGKRFSMVESSLRSTSSSDDRLARSFSGSSMSVTSEHSQISQQSSAYSSLSVCSHSESIRSSTGAISETSIHSHSESSRNSSLTYTESDEISENMRSLIERDTNEMSRLSVHSSISSHHTASPEHLRYSVPSRPWSAGTIEFMTDEQRLMSNDIMPGIPPLPIKKKKGRRLSGYDNVDPSEAEELSDKCAAEYREDLLVTDNDAYIEGCEEDMRRHSIGYGSSQGMDSVDEAPPLPPKIKHINTYMDLLEGYTQQEFQFDFYADTRQSTMDMQAEKREEFFQQSYICPSRLTSRSPRNSYGSSIETSSEGSYDSLEATIPSLPPKGRGSLSVSPEHRIRHYTNPEMRSLPKLELKKKSDSVVIENGKQCNRRSESESSNQDSKHRPTKDKEEGEEHPILHKLNISELLIPNSDVNDSSEPPYKGGPVDALIIYAADADRKELVYSEAFLTTYRTFISSKELLNKLLYRYKKFRHKSDLKCKKANRNAFFLLLRIAGELLGTVEDNILEMLMDLVFQLLCDGELMLAKILRDCVLLKIEDNKKMEKMSNNVPVSALSVSVSRHTLFDFRSLDVAEQMTILDSELFQKIEIAEVLLWAKEQNEEKSPNLTIFTQHFNKMSYWVRSLILQEQKGHDREKLLVKFIKIMKHLRKLNNFNSYLAVLSALDSAPIRRLEWQRQTVDGLTEYCMLIDSSQSFRAYREALASASPPCIPYLGLILQDITFVHLGNPDKLAESEHVNFIKCWQYFNILDSMRRFKQEQYVTLKKNDAITSFFNDFTDYLDEEAMWQLSKEIKPQGKTSRAT